MYVYLDILKFEKEINIDDSKLNAMNFKLNILRGIKKELLETELIDMKIHEKIMVQELLKKFISQYTEKIEKMSNISILLEKNIRWRKNRLKEIKEKGDKYKIMWLLISWFYVIGYSMMVIKEF
jgi:hypothetical protein